MKSIGRIGIMIASALSLLAGSGCEQQWAEWHKWNHEQWARLRGNAAPVKDEAPVEDEAPVDPIKKYELAIDSGKLSPSELAEAYKNRAAACKDRGYLNQAVADYTSAVSQYYPLLASIHNNRGIAYMGKGDFDKAYEDFSKSIELNPTKASTYSNRGIAAWKKGEFDKVIANYTKMIELAPKSAKAHNNRGSAHEKVGDLDKAIADYTRAIEIDPKYSPAYNNRGIAYSKKDKNTAADADFRKAKELASD